MNNNYNILGIIPARAGSTRLPNKNILPFAGKPLSSYIMETAYSTNFINKIAVTSDSDIVLNIASEFNNFITIKRPPELASNKSPAIDYVKHTINFLNYKYGMVFNIIVILQPTSPLTLAQDIDRTIQTLIETKADSAVTVVEVNQMINPLKLKVMVSDRLYPYLEEENMRMAAHELPKVYVRNCAVYATTIDTINNNKIIGNDCRGVIMPPERSVDINTLIDFEFAEYLYLKQLENKA